jgi:hypothetical protein
MTGIVRTAGNVHILETAREMVGYDDKTERTRGPDE